MERHSVDVQGITMQWEQAGEGPPVVLVHGIPTSPRLWRHVVPLVSEARCLAWEMVGYGGSIGQGRDRDISVARQAEYLRAWLDAMGIERAVLAAREIGPTYVQIYTPCPTNIKFPPADTICVAKEAQRGAYSYQEFMSEEAQTYLDSLEKSAPDA